jgi:cystathionine beta-synthase
MAAWVALEVAKRCKPTDLVVVLLPDTGERYLTKVHSDAWMSDNHLLDPTITHVRDLIGGRGRGTALHSLQAGAPLRDALALIEKHDVSQVPVFKGDAVVGTLYDSDILKAALADRGNLDKPVDELMSAPLPVVKSDAPLDDVTRLLAARNSAVLVQQNGSVAGILTRFDMLQFIAGGE